MTHDAQIAFCKHVRNQMPTRFTNATVLDVGSLDVNGTNRWLFSHCHYVGIDLVAGKNVDRVCSVFDVKESFNVVISTETLEHDPEWRMTVAGMCARVKEGGLLLITCAGPGRPEHGTRRCPIPGMSNDTDYYCNVSPMDILGALPLDQFAYYTTVLYEHRKGYDTYFWGVRR